MRKNYITPTITDISFSSTDSLLMVASPGHTTNDNFSRKQYDDWHDDWHDDWNGVWVDDWEDE
jgi:hypothetical protein